MTTILGLWEGTVLEQFQVFRDQHSLKQSLSALLCSAVLAGPTLIWVWKVSTCSVGLRKHQVCFLKLAAAGFEGAEKLFLLESQTEEDLSMIIQPWISTDTFFGGDRIFPHSKKEIFGEQVFLLRTSCNSWYAHKYHHPSPSKQDKGGESSQNWRGLSSVLAADFLICRAHFLLHHPCYSLSKHNLWGRRLDSGLAAYTVYKFLFLEQRWYLATRVSVLLTWGFLTLLVLVETVRLEGDINIQEQWNQDDGSLVTV